MAVLQILSAGAAQAVVQRAGAAFERETGHTLVASFGAVGAMKAKVLSGVPFDVLVLTDAMIDEQIAAGRLAPGRHDLGRVGTGVAVRAGAPYPAVATRDSLRDSLRAASVIAIPDPAIATAGRIVMECLEKLDLLAEVESRLQRFPNGNAAMNWLAAEAPSGAIGITQNTEILPLPGVSYVAPLPEEFQARALYSTGRAAAAHGKAANDFIARLASHAARPMLAAAGFEV